MANGNGNGSARPTRSKKRKTKARRNSGASPVTAPSAGGTIVRRSANVPRFRMRGAATVITNTEYFFSPALSAAGAFTGANGAMQPGNFNWLKGPASSFSKWRWLRLRVIYVPTCPTTTAGRLALGWSYDFNDTAATSITQIQQMNKSVTTPVWAGFAGSSLLHDLSRPISADPGAVALDFDTTRVGSQYFRYIPQATWAALSGPEKNIYAPGQLAIGTAGGVAGTAGDLFVSYEVELIEPLPADLQN